MVGAVWGLRPLYRTTVDSLCSSRASKILEHGCQATCAKLTMPVNANVSLFSTVHPDMALDLLNYFDAVPAETHFVHIVK